MAGNLNQLNGPPEDAVRPLDRALRLTAGFTGSPEEGEGLEECAVALLGRAVCPPGRAL